MSAGLSFDCKTCGEPAAIDNIDYVQKLTGLDAEELKFCKKHLSDALEGVVLNVGIGHTGDEAFKAQRAQRKRDRENAEEYELAKRRESVRLVDVVYDDRVPDHEESPYGESVVIEMPKLAKEDLKELGWMATHRRWDDDRRRWLADADRVHMIREHMESKGWSVDVFVDVS